MRRLALAVTLLVLLPACSLVGGGGGSYHLTAYFPRAISVYPSSQVRVLGLRAGTVKEVVTEGDRVRIELSIDDDVPVPKDVEAALVPQSLIGERYVQLFPAWTNGDPKATDGDVIDLDRTHIPVEPDEALAALKKFLDTLDPDGLGRLVTNAADTLDGNGQALNDALDSVSQLVGTFAEKDETLVSIVDHFDRFTSTLVTREQQLGQVLDAFSAATGVLADERQDIETFLGALADLSQNGLDLVAEHSTKLQHDIEVLTRLAQAVDANLDAVGQLLDSGPVLTSGILDAYNPDLRAFDLRQNFSPLAQSLLQPAIDAIVPGVTLPCVAIPGMGACEAAAPAAPDGVGGLASAAAVPASLDGGATPIDDILGFLGTASAGDASTRAAVRAPSTADQIVDGAGAVGSFLRGAASSLLGLS
jgi:virulence factor Mce-like protein